MRSAHAAPLGAEAAAHPTRFAAETATDGELLDRLRDVCDDVSIADQVRVDAGRDWWPLSVVWAMEGTAPALPSAVARPADAAQVAAVLETCYEAGVPVTPVAGASGVCGGSIPIFGGVSLDLTALNGVIDVDGPSLLVEVRAGTFGQALEDALRSEHGLTLGHWPQSIALSTVGGWIACRGAGQYSTRYGKIEDMVVGLEVAMADGRLIRTGWSAPRAATGPDLTQLFVGSEGTLGVIIAAKLRAHPVPAQERRAAYGFPDFEQGLDACRRILRRGATPAVLRLYDHSEAARNFEVETPAALVVIDEGDPVLVDAMMSVVADECRNAQVLTEDLTDRWLAHRNQLPPLESLVRAGIVADTVEVSGSWSTLPRLYASVVQGLRNIDGTIAASAHQSHAYTDGGCLYFTFAGRPDGGMNEAEAYYRQAFDVVMSRTVQCGGAISHHHGIGLNRGRYLKTYLGPAFDVLTSIKQALDGRGILNPGKLGLPSGFGAVWEE
jgi:alkyldihydroxyacetonephosphate synthase